MDFSKKNTGSYYTPPYLADFISKRVINFFKDRKRISLCEPSVGDGAFLDSFKRYNSLSIKLDGIDINKGELEKAKIKWNKKNATFTKQDFLEFSFKKRYSAIVGNPPYIKKNLLTEGQIEKCKLIHHDLGLSEISVKNIWVTFLVKASQHLTQKGVLAFVLPSELLQVKFAEEIREFLKKQFQRIEIFTFNDLMFECKGQDTIILFAYKSHVEKGEFFTNIPNKKVLAKDAFILSENEILVQSKVKWTHHFLTTDELTFLDKLKGELNSVSNYADSKPGIVTAANKFFIIDKETEGKYRLENYTKPIIQKGLFVNGGVIFNESDYFELENSNLPSRLVQLNNEDELSEGLNEYLALGVEQEIPDRYKCRQRDNWYVIPNISTRPKAMFFKRSHHYPKLIKNESNAFVTDSAYKVEMNGDYDLNSFIFSFYNSLTLLFSETNGRYYGGGVLELTPSEFKALPLPYTTITNNEFLDFVRVFDSKKNIDTILEKYDYQIINSVLKIDQEDIKKIMEIRKKLYKKRMRV